MRITEGVQKRVLENGLTVLAKRTPASEVVAIQTHVKAGYFNEEDRVAGISHLVEHMFFKGTTRRKVGEIASETKMLGGQLNASTSYDHTSYYTILPADELAGGLDIQSDALINSVFDAAELSKETEVVIQEEKRKLDTPSSVTREKLFALAFRQHRMRRWRIGTEEGLRALTREDFLQFYRDHYRPGNIILSIVGDVDPGEALELAERYYGGFEPGAVRTTESPEEPAQTEFRHETLTGAIENGYLAFGFHTPGVLHKDTYALEVLSFILGYGRSARMYQTIKEEKELVNTISAYNFGLPRLGMFMIEATAQPEKIRAAEQAVLAELVRCRDEGVREEELAKARSLLESGYVMSTQSAVGQAALLSSYEALGDYRMLESYLEELYGVDSEDLERVLQTYLAFEKGSLMEYIPAESSVPPLDVAALEKHALVPADIEPDAAAAPASAGAFHIAASPATIDEPAQKILLENGVTLIAKPTHMVPLISCGVFRKGGRVFETEDNCGVSGLMTRTAMKGAKHRDAEQIAAAIEGLGSSISFSSNPDYYSCTMTILSRRFNEGWDILTDILTAPVFPDSEVGHEKAQTISRIRRLRDDMFRYPLTQFYSGVFARHAYGLPALGREESVSQLQRDTLIDWHARSLAREQMLVVAVGDLDVNALKDRVENAFSELPHQGPAIPTLKRPEFHPQDEPVVEHRNKKQSAVVQGFPGPAFAEEDYFILLVLQNLVAGLGGRFFEELRGRQSLAYTVSAYLVSRMLAGTFLSYIATSPEDEEKARAGLRLEFEKLCTTPVSEQELRGAIRFTVGNLKIALESLAAQMTEFAHQELLGSGFEATRTLPERVRAVTREDILAAARRTFDPGKCVENIVRGKKQ